MTLLSMPTKCPRCVDGKMEEIQDRYGPHGSCINCGYVHEPTAAAAEQLREEEKARYASKARHRVPRHGGMNL